MSIGLDTLPLAGTNYPFVAPTGFTIVIEDLHLSLIDPPQISLWLRWVAGLGVAAAEGGSLPPVNPVDLYISNDDNSYVLDTRDFLYSEMPWSAQRRLCTWVSPTAVIVATVVIAEGLKSGYASNTGLLDPRVTDYRPKPVTAIRILDNNVYKSAVRSDGSVRFRAGYNTRLIEAAAVSERGESVRDLLCDFSAGEGLGRIAGCDFSTGVRTLGGASPDANGDLIISGDRCLHIQPQVLFNGDTAVLVPGVFVIKDGCTARCSCDDFTSLYQYTQRTWNRYLTIAARANEIRNAYHSIVNFMRAAKACSERNTLRMFVWPIRECTFAAAVGICNPTDEPLYNIEIEFRLVDGADVDLGGLAACDSIYRIDHHDGQQLPTPYYFEAPFPNARIILRCIPPGSMGYVSFRGVLPSAENDMPIKLCGFCPSPVPLPLPQPDIACHEAKLVCVPTANCEAAESGFESDRIVSNETPSGLINGSNAVFTTANTFVPNTVEISVNGLDQKSGEDYVLTGGNTFEFAVSPELNDIIIVNYRKA